MVQDPARRAARRLRNHAAQGALDVICERFHVLLLVVFGSVVVKDTAPARDVDVAVAFQRGAPRDPVGLVNALIDVADYERIDLLDLGRAGPVARDRALTGTVPLYEAEPGAVARAQMAAALERMDSAWLRRADLSLMAR